MYLLVSLSGLDHGKAIEHGRGFTSPTVPGSRGVRKQDVLCKPENDKDARVSALLSASFPAPSALFLISPPTDQCRRSEIFQHPCKELLVVFQCSCFGSFPEGWCQGRRLSGENTQLATPRNTTSETWPGPARQEQLLQRDLGEWRPAGAPCRRAPHGICSPQKANAGCRMACSCSLPPSSLFS